MKAVFLIFGLLNGESFAGKQLSVMDWLTQEDLKIIIVMKAGGVDMLQNVWKGSALFVLMMCMTACAMASELEVRFFNAGKADACLLKTENSVVVIDTGKNKFGKEMVRFLQENDISEIDILFITHFDKDHVGGADTLLENVKVHQVVEPAYHSNSKQYTQYREAVEATGVQTTALDQNMSFELDGVTYVVDVANQDDYGEDEENDFSLVIAAYFENTSFLFAGDAENPRLLELLNEGMAHFDVLKVPHHGREEALTGLFFQSVSPDYAIITSDDEEPEDETVVDRLRKYGQVYLTRLGDVICTSDGQTVSAMQK